MGLAVLPSRLKEELEILADYLVNHEDIRSNEKIAKHADWAEIFSSKYEEITEANVMEILKKRSEKSLCMCWRMLVFISVRRRDGRRS